MWILRGFKLINWLEARLESYWMIIWWWASWQPWLWTWTPLSEIFSNSPCGEMYWLTQLSIKPTDALKRLLKGITHRNWFLRSSYHVGWIAIATRNGFGAVPSYVLATRAEPTLEPCELSFNNEVQDILRWWMRRAKINCPNVGFMRSWFVQKNPNGPVCC